MEPDSYIDGFVLAVPTANKETFRQHASEAAQIFKKHGALEIVECWGDDVPVGTLTDFRRSVLATDEETVVFAWIEWPDKATRDAGMTAVMADPRMSGDQHPMPFDGKRMIFGGFETMLDR